MRDVDTFLSHHGVMGMKWGVRNNDSGSGRKPAAKDSSDTSLASKIATAKTNYHANSIVKLNARAGILDKRIADIDTTIAGISASKSNFAVKNYKINQQNNQKQLYVQKRKELLKAAQAKQDGKLTTQQKQLIVGAAFVGAMVLGGVLISAHESGAINSSILRGKAFLNGGSLFKLNSSLADPNMSIKDIMNKVVKQVNPNYKAPGGFMNCRRSTFAYEMRRRGFDVAATTTSSGYGQSESGLLNALTTEGKDVFSALSMTQSIQKNETSLDSMLRLSGKATKDLRENTFGKTVIRGLKNAPGALDKEGFPMLRGSSSAKVFEALEKQPNGARGEVMFNFGTFGHSMAYEIVQGKAHIIDSQKAKLYDAAKRKVEDKWDDFNSAEITRLDNIPLDYNFLSRWVTNVSDSV